MAGVQHLFINATRQEEHVESNKKQVTEDLIQDGNGLPSASGTAVHRASIKW